MKINLKQFLDMGLSNGSLELPSSSWLRPPRPKPRLLPMLIALTIRPMRQPPLHGTNSVLPELWWVHFRLFWLWRGNEGVERSWLRQRVAPEVGSFQCPYLERRRWRRPTMSWSCLAQRRPNSLFHCYEPVRRQWLTKQYLKKTRIASWFNIPTFRYVIRNSELTSH